MLKSPVEEAKRRAAQRAVDEHFSPDFNYVGIGSGTTILYVVEAIKAACEIANGDTAIAVEDGSTSPAKQIIPLIDHTPRRASIDDPKHPLHHKIRFVPTGYQSRQVIIQAGLTPIAFDSLPDEVVLDVAFDGADEVDSELNCIKGGGACLFQEKLVATRAKKFVCVAGMRASSVSPRRQAY
jgi:ribose 5-phosphate isomerase A